MRKHRKNKTQRLGVMLTDEMHEQIHELAFKNGLSASTYVRNLIIKAIESEDK